VRSFSGMRAPTASVTRLLFLLTACPPVFSLSAQLPDTTAARQLFEANIRAIHERNRAAYLALYLDAPTFARNGPGGLQLGYAPMATSRDTTWPDSLIATDLRLVPVRPGVVYGQYRYRVTQNGRTTNGTSERIFVQTPRGWRIAVSTAFAAPEGTPPAPVALLGATLIDGTGAAAVSDAAVVVDNGRIACAGPRSRCPVPAGTDTMNLRGAFIIPGLIDAHVHFSQTGWVDGRPDALDLRTRGYPYDSTQAYLEARPDRFFRSYVCSGVTGVFDVGGYPWTWALRSRAERDLTAPHVAAAGPLLSSVPHDILNLPDTRQIHHVPTDSAARAAVRAHVARGSDAIKVWFVVRQNADTTALRSMIRAAGDEAHRLGARLIVHATSLWSAKEALRAGADVLVHSVENAPVDDEFLQLARERNVIYTPTLTVYDGYRQVRFRRFNAHYPTACVDSVTLRKARSTDSIPGGTPLPATPPPEVSPTIMNNLRRVAEAGITVAMGTDAGNPLTLHGPSVYWEMQVMVAAGMTPLQVLVAATRNGALAMGRRDIGTLETGRLADLVVLDADPLADIGNVSRIRYVMRGGALTTPALVAPR
jgi:imidazolonepropionase-like amidohydrolase